jgi:hypothetical protein
LLAALACLGLVALGLALSSVLSSSSSSSSSSSRCRCSKHQSPEVVVTGDAAQQMAGTELSSLLKVLLPLTNMGALSAAALLDAGTASGLGPPELRRLVQLHQSLFCT